MQQGQSQHQAHKKYYALIPAAGVGSRMGLNIPKQYLHIAGQSVLQHTIDGFLSADEIEHVFVVVSADDAFIDDQVKPHERVTILRCGGATRSESVSNGLQAMQALQTAHNIRATDFILVHDAARPGINATLIQQLINAVKPQDIGGLLALPVVDTVKRLHNGVVETISREGLWLAQTPQMFSYELLCHALDAAPDMTDEASAVEALGLSPILVEGHACNRKLTLPNDEEFLRPYLTLQLGNK